MGPTDTIPTPAATDASASSATRTPHTPTGVH
jgi:hypothetical protein